MILAGHGIQLDAEDKTKSAFFFCPADADITELTHLEKVTEVNVIDDSSYFATTWVENKDDRAWELWYNQNQAEFQKKGRISGRKVIE